MYSYYFDARNIRVVSCDNFRNDTFDMLSVAGVQPDSLQLHHRSRHKTTQCSCHRTRSLGSKCHRNDVAAGAASQALLGSLQCPSANSWIWGSFRRGDECMRGCERREGRGQGEGERIGERTEDGRGKDISVLCILGRIVLV